MANGGWVAVMCVPLSAEIEALSFLCISSRNQSRRESHPAGTGQIEEELKKGR
jgi:hypothetical protein